MRYNTPTTNMFLLDSLGVVKWVKHPDKVIHQASVIGLNLFDMLLPEYIDSVKEGMADCIRLHTAIPTEFYFCLEGVIRHKKGFIKPHKDGILFHVYRVPPLYDQYYDKEIG